jgi:hypothetical protein
MPKKKTLDVKIIIPDASPILTLARVNRLELLQLFAVPIHIVDQVQYEVTKSANDPQGRVADMFHKLHNQLIIVETNVGVGFQTRRARDPKTPSSNLGEIAVDEYATQLARTTGPSFIPLVLFEDPDVLELRIAKLKDVHLLNTTAWLNTLYEAGELPDGRELIAEINAARKTPLDGFEKPARTKKIRSQWLKRRTHDAG